MGTEAPCKTRVKETLNRLPKKTLDRLTQAGNWSPAVSGGLVVQGGEIHQRNCQSIEGEQLSRMPLTCLLELEAASCCIRSTADLPGKVKDRIGRDVLEYAELLLDAEKALTTAPEPRDLTTALEVLSAEAERVQVESTIESWEGTPESDVALREFLEEVLASKALNDKVRRARRILEEDEAGLTRLCWDEAWKRGMDPDEDTKTPLLAAAWLSRGKPRLALRSSDDPLIRATLLHYVAETDALAVVPLGAWRLWRADALMLGAELGEGAFTIFDPSKTDPSVLQCLARDSAAAGDYINAARLDKLVELASVVR